MAYRIAVLDDDIRELDRTAKMLSLYGETHPQYELEIACFQETGSFMEAMCTGADTAEWAYDILFLDVYLPDGNGIKCGRILRDKGFTGVIIYKSSTSDNCLDAFAVDAMQYLIKPVSEEKLFRILDEAIKKVLSIKKNTAEYCGVSIQTKEKRRKSIKEFLKRWFHGDS